MNSHMCCYNIAALLVTSYLVTVFTTTNRVFKADIYHENFGMHVRIQNETGIVFITWCKAARLSGSGLVAFGLVLHEYKRFLHLLATSSEDGKVQHRLKLDSHIISVVVLAFSVLRASCDHRCTMMLQYNHCSEPRRGGEFLSAIVLPVNGHCPLQLSPIVRDIAWHVSWNDT